MKIKLIGILLAFSFYYGAAQPYKIQKAFAFYTSTMPGTIRVDDNGNRIKPVPSLERFIFIETNYKGKPEISEVLYNAISFNNSVDAIKEEKLTVGINATNGQPVIIRPQKGNHLWKITLQQTSVDRIIPGQVKKIVLKCKLGNAIIKQVVYNEVQLSVPDSY